MWTDEVPHPERRFRRELRSSRALVVSCQIASRLRYRSTLRSTTEASVTEGEIRERIRRMLRTGDLACDDDPRVWAGEGSGNRCAACLEPIVPSSVEYEADLNGRTLHFHMQCHQMWLEECEPDTNKHA